MNLAMFESLYAYHDWANDRLLAQAEALSAETLARQTSKGYQAIHPTFVHLLSADTRWLARWRNQAPGPPVTVAEAPALAVVRERWAPLRAERRAYLAGLSEADLQVPIQLAYEGTTVELTRWQGLLQCANHGTQHRSEIAAMLTDAGRSPGDLDYAFFCRR